MTTTSHPGETSTKRRGVLAAVAKRRPTVLGVAAAIETFIDAVTEDTTRSYAEAMLMLPLLYVIVAALGRRRAACDMARARRARRAVCRAAPSGPGRACRRLPRGRSGRGDLGQRPRAGLSVEPDLARYLVAAGWFAHGVWDWAHLAKDRVVSRSFAEWCRALDVMIATALIVVPLL
jgi:hypothetical protein